MNKLEVLKEIQNELQNGVEFHAKKVQLQKERLEVVNTLIESEKTMRDYKTCELVEELKNREGVEVHIAAPHQDIGVSVNGPAIILVITD